MWDFSEMSPSGLEGVGVRKGKGGWAGWWSVDTEVTVEKSSLCHPV